MIGFFERNVTLLSSRFLYLLVRVAYFGTFIFCFSSALCGASSMFCSSRMMYGSFVPMLFLYSSYLWGVTGVTRRGCGIFAIVIWHALYLHALRLRVS